MSRGDTRKLCEEAARRAASAKLNLATTTGAERARLLVEIASMIRRRRDSILRANQEDLDRAEGMTSSKIDRLRLDDVRIAQIADSVRAVANQPDPNGAVIEERRLANGIRLAKRKVPLGVVLVIYESRPNVTSDAAALCFKAACPVLLKGGREAEASNRAITAAIHEALAPAGLQDAVTFVDTTDRQAIPELVSLTGFIDLAIPRGGPELIKVVSESARVPVIKHDAGNCHIYVDEAIEGIESIAVDIVVNAKTQRPGVCNAAEKLLIHERVAESYLPRIADELLKRGVELRGDERVCRLVPQARPATESDWATEYLDLIMGIKIVESLDDAAAHIRKYGSRHTEAIISTSQAAAQRFIAQVDSASVMVNCSTRFADGGEYGLGAEIGISTSVLHARGPMGAADLTTYQWVLEGDGQIRT